VRLSHTMSRLLEDPSFYPSRQESVFCFRESRKTIFAFEREEPIFCFRGSRDGGRCFGYKGFPNMVLYHATGDWTGRDKRGESVRSLRSPSSRGIAPPLLTLSRETSVAGRSISQLLATRDTATLISHSCFTCCQNAGQFMYSCIPYSGWI